MLFVKFHYSQRNLVNRTDFSKLLTPERQPNQQLYKLLGKVIVVNS